MNALAVTAAATMAVLLIMVAELVLSRANERWLRANGAVEVPDEVYRTMRWAYPGTFVAMGIEGAVAGPIPGIVTAAGVAVFVLAKALKFWAMASLGKRWSYGVFVLTGQPLVGNGPYRWLRHPNYVAVIGELVGMAIIVGARITGPLMLLFFGWLLWRRIKVEDRALVLGHRGRAPL